MKMMGLKNLEIKTVFYKHRLLCLVYDNLRPSAEMVARISPRKRVSVTVVVYDF
jgi:hypothetical protein